MSSSWRVHNTKSLQACNITNTTLSPEEVNTRRGKWGVLHKDYLLKHKKVLFLTLLAEGKPWQYLADVDTLAQQMFDTLVEQMKQTESVTEELKEENRMEWVKQIGNIQQRARDYFKQNGLYVKFKAGMKSLPL